MNTGNTSLLLAAYGISNLIGLLILWAAFTRPRLARLGLLLMFGWAAWINYSTVHQNPEVYLSYGNYAIGWYAVFINGWFRNYITPVVSMIAFGQVLIAIGLACPGIWLKIACAGVIVFLLAIAPFGLGSAFPFSLTVALAAWQIMRKDNGAPIWV